MPSALRSCSPATDRLRKPACKGKSSPSLAPSLPAYSSGRFSLNDVNANLMDSGTLASGAAYPIQVTGRRNSTQHTGMYLTCLHVGLPAAHPHVPEQDVVQLPGCHGGAVRRCLHNCNRRWCHRRRACLESCTPFQRIPVERGRNCLHGGVARE